jgi:putative ABC transport system permease protein
MSMTDAVLPELAGKTPLTSRGFGWLQIVGRLAPEATVQQAQLDAVAAAPGGRRADDARRGPSARALLAVDAALDPSGAGRTTRLAWLLFGIVACVLLLACSDAAGLLVVRAEERKREVAIRRALGASARRIASQLLVESVLLSGVSAVVGLVFAVWLSDVLVSLAQPGLLLPHENASPVMGTRVLFFTASAALLTAVLFGTAPLLDRSGAQLSAILRSEGRFVSAIGGRFRLRYAFVVLQVALSAVLLVGAGLLLRTLWNAYRVDLGFDTAHLLVGSVDVGKQGYNEAQSRQVFEQILEEVRAIPGVRSAALARSAPVQRSVMRMAVVIDGADHPSQEEADVNVVGPDFFATLGVTMLRGRAFEASDTAQSPAVMVVNQAFAERYWPGGDAIGKRLRSPAPGTDAQVVGVVANFKLRSLRELPTPVMFAAATQFYLPRMTIAVRTESDPSSTLGLLRAAVARVDRDLPLFNVRTANEQLGLAVAQERIVAGLLVTFATVAVVLAATGFYALFSYLTRLRSREFAIRIALGAGRADLISLVVGKSATLAALGITAGLAAALLLSSALADLLFGVSPLDATSFAVSALLLLAVPTLASYIPARRAARIDPAAALRRE